MVFSFTSTTPNLFILWSDLGRRCNSNGEKTMIPPTHTEGENVRKSLEERARVVAKELCEVLTEVGGVREGMHHDIKHALVAFAKDYAKEQENKCYESIAYEQDLKNQAKNEVSRLTAEVGELKKALDHWTLMHIQESARSAKLEANLKIAVGALEKISHADDENHYGEEGLALMVCVETSKSALFRLKSGGGA